MANPGMRHAYTSTKSDPVDTSLVGKTKWNDRHYFYEDDGTTASGTLGDLLYRGTSGLVTLLTGAQGVLTSAGSGNVPAWSMTPTLTSLTINSTGSLTIGSRGSITASADGSILLLNNAGTGFTQIQFGGTGAGVPAIRKSGASLLFRTGNDAADIGIEVLSITTSQTTFMHKTNGALANGAAAQTATLTNGPTAGNPTKWIPISDNGTTRYIPAW